MYPAKDARELAILLRISRELDIVGDVTATVDNPSELLAWALVLTDAEVLAWRSDESEHRYLQVTADRHRPPIRGTVAAVLDGEHHPEYCKALGLDKLTRGERKKLTIGDLSAAWAVMPITPTEPETDTSPDTSP